MSIMSDLVPSDLYQNAIEISEASIARIIEKIHVLPNGCWEWIGAKSKGYGVVKIRAYKGSSNIQCHRITGELIYGHAPGSLDAHHLVENGCIGPACCHPDHTDYVSRRRHIVELTPGSLSHIAAGRSSCAAGHEYVTGSYRYLTDGSRRCRICDNERHRKAAAEKRGDRSKGKWHSDKRRTHCKRGHEFTPENTYYVDGYKGCRQCRNEYRMRKKLGLE